MKTVRFSQVVAAAGRPAIHLLWTTPAKDTVLQRASQGHRVMTIHLETRGSKVGFGHVGLPSGDEKSQILVFPKSLKAFADSRVVGIDYDLTEPGLESGSAPEAPARKDQPKTKPIPKPEPAVKPAPAQKAEPREIKTEAASPVSPVPQAARKADGDAVPSADSKLMKAIRAAMKDLEKGNAVAAYKRLEAVTGDTPGRG